MLAQLATELRLQNEVNSSPPKILRMNMSVTEGETLDVAALDMALTLWFGWKQNAEHAPVWSSFKPFSNPHLLPRIMLYERIEGRFRCAIVGEHVVSNLGAVKLARRFIDEAMPAANLADVTMRLDEALSSETPNFVEKTMSWKEGHDLKCYRALQLPFRTPENGNARVLSIMDFQSTPV